MNSSADIRPYLSPTPVIDSDHPAVIDFARRAVAAANGGGDDRRQAAVAIYYAVRDGIWYDPYYPFYRPEHYRASSVLASGRGYCVSKAALLCALSRAIGIPCRLGFATVRNHLATRQLIDFLGSDLFVYHGFVEFLLGGRWVQATPAFNRELCERHRVEPLEFDGVNDSIFHEYNLDSKKFMEYVTYHGTWADVPVDRIVSEWEKAYGRERVRRWIATFEASGGKSIRDFYREDVL
jgi:transglutaminase-like putative cysteine protease